VYTGAYLCDSAGGSIVQPRTTTSFLHAESHHAVRHVIVADARHLPLTTGPRREDLARHLHPPLVLRLHAVHLREHAQDVRKSASLWCVKAMARCYGSQTLHFQDMPYSMKKQGTRKVDQNQMAHYSFLFMVALCNRADHIYFHPVSSSSSSSFFFPRLISAVGDWMSTILRHMVWS